jgi:hypothetical protein
VLLKSAVFGSRVWKPGSPNGTVKAVARYDSRTAAVTGTARATAGAPGKIMSMTQLQQQRSSVAPHIPGGTVYDDAGEPLFGEYRVQLLGGTGGGGQQGEKFSRVTIQAGRAVCGGELIFSKPHNREVEKRMGFPSICDLTTPDTRIGRPKTQRQGHPHCLRVTLGRPDSRGVEKYVIDCRSNGELERWLACLTKLAHGQQYGYTLRRRQGIAGDVRDTVAEGRKARGGRADDEADYEFGDWMRGVAAKGKQARDDEARASGAHGGGGGGSAFADFARGLMK